MDVEDLAIEPLGANESVDIDELVAVYDAVGWSAYTREREAFVRRLVGRRWSRPRDGELDSSGWRWRSLTARWA